MQVKHSVSPRHQLPGMRGEIMLTLKHLTAGVNSGQDRTWPESPLLCRLECKYDPSYFLC